MRRNAVLCALILALCAPLTLAASTDRWLHVRVEENGGDPETVNVNIPLSLVSTVLPLIEHDEIRGGRIRLIDDDLGETDLRAIWEAVRESKDANYVTVQEKNQKLRVAKKGDFVLVNATERDGDEDTETVDVRIPMNVVDALFSGDSDELDIAAAIQALGEHTDFDLVSVKDGDSRVRIWIDSSESGE